MTSAYLPRIAPSLAPANQYRDLTRAEFLAAFWRRGQGRFGEMTSGDLAFRLGRDVEEISAMLSGLTQRGLTISDERIRGKIRLHRLTEAGRQEAMRFITGVAG